MENKGVKIWKMSHSGDVTKYREKFLERQVIVLHKDTRKNQGKFFREELKKGDLFYLCFGSSAIKLIGRVTSDNAVENPEMGKGWIERSYEIVKKSTSNNKFKGSPKWWLPSGNTTIRKIKDSELSEFEEIILKPFFEITLDQMEGAKKIDMTSYINRLIESKNLILHGAPGTGKTYLAKQIASEIVSDGQKQKWEDLSDDEKSQIGFVQFHPSYDYTDFVEGLRPVSSDDGQIGFKLKDGIFREFCERAKKATESGGQDNFDEAWDKFFEAVSDVDTDSSYDIKTLTGKSMHLVAYNTYHGMSGVMEKGSASLFYNKAQCYNIYKGDPGVPKRGLDNYRKAVVKHLKEKYGLVDYVKPTETTTDKNFVFIIDEINRGEISKIFGELFFSIDPDYRGEKGAVSTQYANLHETDEKFYIPENVYIIGTMNDIDRSVDTFDFAMRRRFRFVEVKAEDRLEMLDEKLGDNAEEAKARLTNLNKAISKADGLNSHYHIGPSYFLKLKDLDYDLLWSDYLKPLLEDYVRGQLNEKELMKAFEDAYYSPAKVEESADDNTQG